MQAIWCCFSMCCSRRIRQTMFVVVKSKGFVGQRSTTLSFPVTAFGGIFSLSAQPTHLLSFLDLKEWYYSGLMQVLAQVLWHSNCSWGQLQFFKIPSSIDPSFTNSIPIKLKTIKCNLADTLLGFVQKQMTGSVWVQGIQSQRCLQKQKAEEYSDSQSFLGQYLLLLRLACPTAGGDPASLCSEQLSEAERSAEHFSKAVIDVLSGGIHLVFAFSWGSVCVWVCVCLQWNPSLTDSTTTGTLGGVCVCLDVCTCTCVHLEPQNRQSLQCESTFMSLVPHYNPIKLTNYTTRNLFCFVSTGLRITLKGTVLLPGNKRRLHAVIHVILLRYNTWKHLPPRRISVSAKPFCVWSFHAGLTSGHTSDPMWRIHGRERSRPPWPSLARRRGVWWEPARGQPPVWGRGCSRYPSFHNKKSSFLDD